MTKALQCPACGYKHVIEGKVFEQFFTCEACKKKLKLPSSMVQKEEISLDNEIDEEYIHEEDLLEDKPKRKFRYKLSTFLVWIIFLPISLYCAYKIIQLPPINAKTADFIHIVTGAQISKYYLLLEFILAWSILWSLFISLFSVIINKMERRKNAF